MTTVNKIYDLVRTGQISRMVLNEDQVDYFVEFFVPKKKVEFMIQWCENNMAYNINWKVSSLWGIGKTMKIRRVEHIIATPVEVHEIEVKMEIK